jgi:hypothetical protein
MVGHLLIHNASSESAQVAQFLLWWGSDKQHSESHPELSNIVRRTGEILCVSVKSSLHSP